MSSERYSDPDEMTLEEQVVMVAIHRFDTPDNYDRLMQGWDVGPYEFIPASKP